jgi:cystathionine gamma-synthase/methionine-gamma-lyase
MLRNKPKRHSLSTRCVHAGEPVDERGALHVPLYNYSTFGFRSTDELLDVVGGRTAANIS